MFGISVPELLVVLAIALIFIGPKKFPDFAKAFGRAFREFRSAVSETMSTLDVDEDVKEVKKSLTDINANLKKGVRDLYDSAPLNQDWTRPKRAAYDPEADHAAEALPDTESDAVSGGPMETPAETAEEPGPQAREKSPDGEKEPRAADD